MRKSAVILFAVLSGAFGCRHPDPLQLTPTPPDSSNQVQILSLATSDTSHLGDSVLTTGNPADNVTFGGTISLQRTLDDYVPFGSVRRIDTLDFASMVFLDKGRPVQDNSGRVYGYFGVPLAKASIGVLGMNVRPHYVHIPLVGDSLCGVEYRRLLSGIYHPDEGFTLGVSVVAPGTVTLGIKTPNDLVIHSPIGGATFNRNASMDLSWTGSGDLSIIISEYYPLRKTARALLYIKPAVNAGHLTLASRVLQLLPEDHRQYVFTFILSNRTEITAVSGYAAKVLVQAAVVYNSYVQVMDE